jgi:hypothetical protein
MKRQKFNEVGGSKASKETDAKPSAITSELLHQ